MKGQRAQERRSIVAEVDHLRANHALNLGLYPAALRGYLGARRCLARTQRSFTEIHIRHATPCGATMIWRGLGDGATAAVGLRAS